jgi:hypothetical protein
MQPSTSTTFAPALSLLKIKGARSVGVFRETGVNELYYISSRNGVIEAAQNNKMSVVADLTVPFTDTLDANSTVIMKAIIAKMQQVNPDVIVGVVLETGCHAFVRAARLMKYTAGSFVIAVCASNPSLFKAVLGQDGRYVMGPVGWDRRLTGRTYNEDGSLNIHYFPHLNVSCFDFFPKKEIGVLQIDVIPLGHSTESRTVWCCISIKIWLQSELPCC